MTTAFEHVNRKGQRYLLCETKTKTGKPRYVFSREPTGTPVATIPAGYEVAESVNGVVSLRKMGTCLIRDEEVAVVKAALGRHHLAGCRVDAKKREITIYQPPNPSLDIERLSPLFGPQADALRLFASRVPLSPVLRFLLDDEEERMFVVERMAYRGSFNGWHGLDGGPLKELAERYVRHIGKESFFDLM